MPPPGIIVILSGAKEFRYLRFFKPFSEFILLQNKVFYQIYSQLIFLMMFLAP